MRELPALSGLGFSTPAENVSLLFAPDSCELQLLGNPGKGSRFDIFARKSAWNWSRSIRITTGTLAPKKPSTATKAIIPRSRQGRRKVRRADRDDRSRPRTRPAAIWRKGLRRSRRRPSHRRTVLVTCVRGRDAHKTGSRDRISNRRSLVFDFNQPRSAQINQCRPQ